MDYIYNLQVLGHKSQHIDLAKMIHTQFSDIIKIPYTHSAMDDYKDYTLLSFLSQ